MYCYEIRTYNNNKKKNKYIQRFQLTKHTCFWMYAAGGSYNLVASCDTCDGSVLAWPYISEWTTLRVWYPQGTIVDVIKKLMDLGLSNWLLSYIMFVRYNATEYTFVVPALWTCLVSRGTLERARNFRKEHPDYFISIVIFFDHLVYICYTSH